MSSQFAVARFTTAGTVDTGFGDGGTVLTSVGGYVEVADIGPPLPQKSMGRASREQSDK